MITCTNYNATSLVGTYMIDDDSETALLPTINTPGQAESVKHIEKTGHGSMAINTKTAKAFMLSGDNVWNALN